VPRSIVAKLRPALPLLLLLLLLLMGPLMPSPSLTAAVVNIGKKTRLWCCREWSVVWVVCIDRKSTQRTAPTAVAAVAAVAAARSMPAARGKEWEQHWRGRVRRW